MYTSYKTTPRNPRPHSYPLHSIWPFFVPCYSAARVAEETDFPGGEQCGALLGFCLWPCVPCSCCVMRWLHAAARDQFDRGRDKSSVHVIPDLPLEAQCCVPCCAVGDLYNDIRLHMATHQAVVVQQPVAVPVPVPISRESEIQARPEHRRIGRLSVGQGY